MKKTIELPHCYRLQDVAFNFTTKTIVVLAETFDNNSLDYLLTLICYPEADESKSKLMCLGKTGHINTILLAHSKGHMALLINEDVYYL